MTEEARPYNVATIRRLLLAAFTTQTLRRFCHDHPSFRPIVDTFGPSHGLDDMVDEVITYCERHLLFDELLAGVKKANPKQYARFVEPELPVKEIQEPEDVELAPPPPDRHVRLRDRLKIGQGLSALIELMRTTPKVQAAVVTFRADFRAAREQVATLINYKDLHNLLHTLQFHCYNPIVWEAMRFLDDEMTTDNLEYYAVDLQEILEDLKAVIERASFAPTETLWIQEWMQELVEARETLEQAIEGSDAKLLKRVMWLLNRILAVQPSKINTRLNAAARALRLCALVETMTRVRDNLAGLDLDPAKMNQFESGVEALTSLLHSLTALVDAHDRWQVVDLELRRIEANVELDTEEVEMSWADLKAKTELLSNGSTDEWARSLRKDTDNLDNAITTRNPARIKQCFRCYRRQAGVRFHHIDADLKRLCEELRKIGEPLAAVMRMIE